MSQLDRLGQPFAGRWVNENLSRELLVWLTQAGLAGTPESDIFSVFCDRCVAAGIPLGRAHVAIDSMNMAVMYLS